MSEKKTKEEKEKATAKKESAQSSAEMMISVKEYQELTECADTRREYFDKLLRLHAEFENFKKRTNKERQQFLKFANESLIYELVNILDNFERAFDSANKMVDFKSLHQGVEMILKQIHQLFVKNGVKRIDCLGKTFDPIQQEAIAHIETDKYPENTVIEEVQKGYLLEDRLIRPAVVKVAKKPFKKEEREVK